MDGARTAVSSQFQWTEPADNQHPPSADGGARPSLVNKDSSIEDDILENVVDDLRRYFDKQDLACYDDALITFWRPR